MNPGRELDALIAEKVMLIKTWEVYYPTGEETSDWDHLRHPYETFLTKQEAELFAARKKSKKAPSWAQPNVVQKYLKHYSTDIAAAWEVAEKIKFGSRKVNSDGWEVKDTFHLRYNDPEWCAGHLFAGWNHYPAENWSVGDTAPHAICLAALKAINPEGDK